MAEEEEDGVTSLVLGGGGDMTFHRQVGEIVLDVGGGQLLRRLVFQITSEPCGKTLEKLSPLRISK